MPELLVPTVFAVNVCVPFAAIVTFDGLKRTLTAADARGIARSASRRGVVFDADVLRPSRGIKEEIHAIFSWIGHGPGTFHGPYTLDRH